MFKRNHIPVLVGIILLSGMFLMGQESWYPCPEIPLALVPKTGQTTSYAVGDDGGLEAGVPEPDPRFTDNGDGTVTDNRTSLIWMKDAGCAGTKTWANALSYCNSLANGTCGLSDGSQAGDWRMPNRFELESLLDMGNHDPTLPSGHPFTSVQNVRYWSSTTLPSVTSYASCVGFSNGDVYNYAKTNGTIPVWCVRD